METIRGAFIRFLSAPGSSGSDSGLAIVRYESSGQLVNAKVSGPFSPMIQENEWIVAEGEWRPSFYKGNREEVFRARSIHPDLPATKIGAGQLFAKTFNQADHGITAKAISDFTARHGDRAALMAESDPRLLLEMTSDPARYATTIFRDWARRISGRQAVRFLEAAGVSDNAVKAILRVHRDNTMNVINANPYQLASIKAVGFTEADKIGRKAGIASNDPRRVGAAVVDVVSNDDDEGHTYTPFSAMKDGLDKNGVDIDAMRRLISAGDANLVFDKEDGAPVAQKRYWHDCEKKIAVNVARLVERARAAPRQHVDMVSREILSKQKYAHFDDVQKNAVMMGAREHVSILTGGPGTGKSTVTEAIAEIAAETSSGPVILMAPTGKAARRLEETTGRSASTVHKALEATGSSDNPKFGRNKSNPLPAGCFVVVDEASMLDVQVTAALFDALPPDGRILFVGDRHQLPSVGPGYVLGDMIAARAPNGARVPCTELINVYRNKHGSMIAHGAAAVREGTFETARLDNVMRGGVMMYDFSGSAIVDQVVYLMTKLIPKSLKLDAMKDVAVLSPQRPGTAGLYELNTALSRALNPHGRAIDGLVYGPNQDRRMPLPRIKDRVMMTRNDYENDVMNGDIGTIVDAFEDSSGPRKEKKVKVEFDSGQTVCFPVSRCRDLQLAYAITGHKSQGSQYPCVIMPISEDHSRILDRTLVYTEWTRAKDFLILVGEENVLANAISNTSAAQRRTRLKSFLEHTLVQALGMTPIADFSADIGSEARSEAKAPPVPPQVRASADRPAPAPVAKPPAFRPLRAVATRAEAQQSSTATPAPRGLPSLRIPRPPKAATPAAPEEDEPTHCPSP